MSSRSESGHPLQPVWLLLPLGLLYLASLGRLVYLQAVLGPSSARAAWQRMFVMQPLPAPRGRILDREGRTLAEDTPVWRLILDAPPGRRLPPSPGRLEALSRLLGRGSVLTAELWKSDHVYSVISGGLSSETARRIRLLLAGLPGSGLKLEPSWRRSYPQGCSLAHLIGYLAVGAGGRERRGAYGLEKICDSLLLGRDGLASRQLAGPGYGIDPALEKRAPRPPRDLRTTLDACIGLIVARELERVAREQEPEWAVAVVLDPGNGELLAMGSWPDFDPGDIAGSLQAAGSPAALTNRALSDPVEPGSTCKPFVIGRALAEGVLRSGEKIDAEHGSWNLGVRTIHDVHPGGLLDPREILVRSSNIAAGKVGLKMGAERLKRVFRDFRFAEPIVFFGRTSAAGILPSEREWRKRLWTLPSVSFGQQVALTPARLAWSFAALVNGGLLYPPRILAEAPREPPRRVLPASVSAFLRDAMVGVVEEGTGRKLPSRSGFHWGGKSGTVQKTHEPGYTSLFVAFGPAAEPRILVAVVVENPSRDHYGRVVAGPVAARILEQSLVIRGVLPPSAKDSFPAAPLAMAPSRP